MTDWILIFICFAFISVGMYLIQKHDWFGHG